MKKLILLKIGGSVLTNRKKAFTEDRKAIKRISKEISKGYDPKKMKMVLVHGAGSFGHLMVHRNKIHKGILNRKQLVDFAETQTWQNRFNAMITESLQKEGVPAIPILASSMAVMSGIKLKKMDLEAIKELLKIGMVPVLYGVPAVDKKQGCSILSGDQIISWLGKELHPKMIIHGTDVEGVFDGDPKTDRKSRIIREISTGEWKEIKNKISGSTTVDVTGGMMLKVSEMIPLARKGISSLFVSAKKPGNLTKVIEGKKIEGTVLKK